MSNGAFTDAIYETDAGNFVRIRVQPETIAATDGTNANAQGAGPLTAGFPSAFATNSRRRFGINGRTVRVKWTTAPTGYDDDFAEIVVLTPATFLAWQPNVSITYAGGTGTIVLRSGEVIK